MFSRSVVREKRTFYDCPPSRNRPRCSSSKSTYPNPSRRKDPTKNRLHSPCDEYLDFPLPPPTNRIRCFPISFLLLVFLVPPSPFPLPPRLDSRECQGLLQNLENLTLLSTMMRKELEFMVYTSVAFPSVHARDFSYR